MTGYFDDHGIRFAYPLDWEIEVNDDGSRTIVTIQAADGMAFAFVAIDADCPEPEEAADEALAAMQEEYPDLDAIPARETIDGQTAIGYDVEFISLDMVNSCVIRCYRTPRRTVLIFGQWSQLDDERAEVLIRAVRSTFQETDA